MGLEISTHEHGTASVIALSGELDIYTVPAFRSALDVHDPLRSRLIVDLSEVTLLDSSGLGSLVSILNRTREGQGQLGLVCPQRQIRRVFEITGLRRAFVFGDDVSSVDTALEEFSAPPAS